MGVRYKDWSEPPPGTRVKYVGDSSFTRNREGTTVGEVYPAPGTGPARNLVRVKFDHPFGTVSRYVSNLERINEVPYANNLVGPKPEPVKEPKFVTPFRHDGRNIVDANRRVVLNIRYGGYILDTYRTELPMAEACELARLIAEALTEKFAPAKVADSESPF